MVRLVGLVLLGEDAAVLGGGVLMEERPAEEVSVGDCGVRRARGYGEGGRSGLL